MNFVSYLQLACSIMVDWLVDRYQSDNDESNALSNHSLGTDVYVFTQYMCAEENDEDVSSKLSGRSELKYQPSTGTFSVASNAADRIRECSPMNSATLVPFTNVEGEGDGFVMFGRCSRTMRLISTTNTKECVSCGRAATMDSLKWEWLGECKGCGVCGTALR